MRKSILIILFTLLGIFSAHAYNFYVDGIYYNIISGTEQVAVTYRSYNYDNYSGSVVIPSTVTYDGNTYTVTSIGYAAFRGCSGLTSVTIPNSVTSIWAEAFYECSGLTSVYYTGNLTQWCGIVFQRWVSSDSGWNLYVNNVKVTDLLIPDGVTSIGSYAFLECSGLTSVTIPNSVTSIGQEAFYNCSGLTSVTIPNSVTSIGSYAFRGCSGLTSVTIPNSVTSIGSSAFRSCSGLTSVKIPEGVDTIWDYTFSSCSGLTLVTIPNSVTSIGEAAFQWCNSLTSVTIPNSVTSIGNSAFRGCSGLTSVEWNAIKCRYVGGAYYGTGYEEHPFYGCENITTVTFGNQVERIPSYFLYYKTNKLTSITLPESVTSIGEGAFEGCYGLRSVTIGEGVTDIGAGAFYNCIALLSVTSLAKLPPICNIDTYLSYYEDVFSNSAKPTEYSQKLYVPRGSKSLYESAFEWHKFSKIEEISGEGTAMVTVHPNDAAMGTVTGGGEYKEGEQAMLAAIPYQGYYFAKWDDGNTNNPRILAVSGDTTITAIFAKNGDNPTANENPEADNFRVYVQERTIYLSEYRGAVQVYNMAGQCVYNGHATAIPVQQGGVYVVRVGARSYKVIVR